MLGARHHKLDSRKQHERDKLSHSSDAPVGELVFGATGRTTASHTNENVE
jgi:hypothetical protein